MRTRRAPGGGIVVEVEPNRLVGWVNRFDARNGGIVDLRTTLSSVAITSTGGTTATISVPFAPMALAGAEPIEAILDHLRGIGLLAVILVRANAYSIGVCKDGTVVSSSTDTRYVQGRTAAGGWSQQRYARRRGNQLRASLQAAADAVHRVLTPISGTLRAVVAGGDASGIHTVLQDGRLTDLASLPRRVFGDVGDPRRAVLDEVAARSLNVEITVRGGGSAAAPGDRRR